MELKIFWSDKIKLDPEFRDHFQKFVQGMANALAIGHVQYGHPSASQGYMKRLGLEYQNYKSTGNGVKLMDCGNYAVLEAYKPSNKRFHVDHHAESSTRKVMSSLVGKSRGQKGWGQPSPGHEDY